MKWLFPIRRLTSCLGVAVLCGVYFVSIPVIAAEAEDEEIVTTVRMAISSGDLDGARSEIKQFVQLHGQTAAALEALSWLARAELGAGALNAAFEAARQTLKSADILLKQRKLDAEPHLPMAVGAAYEVQSQVLDRRNQKSEAVLLLQTALRRWANTSISPRLRKNLNLLTLEGKPAPTLSAREWLGTPPQSIASLRGKVVLIFFWAHWCPDCKAEAPVLQQLAKIFGLKGLVILAPTQRYGYTARSENVSPEEEKAYIERVFDQFYAQIPQQGVSLDRHNFDVYGASTTPTLVLIDRAGIVRLYHPGAMDGEELASAVHGLLRN